METERIAWHPAFSQAFELELENEPGVFEFKSSHQLTAEPLEIDLIIIKKKKGAAPASPLAAVFRGSNIVEFKSHSDYLSVPYFYKVYAYALLYISFEKGADINDTTITFVSSRYPKSVIKHLEEARKYTVMEERSGIYVVKEDVLPIQFIETKRLDRKDGAYLRLLSGRPDKEDLRFLVKASKSPHKVKMGAFLDAVLRMNAEEVYKMGVKTLEAVLEETGLIAEWEARGEKRGRELGEEFGIKIGEAHGEERGRELGRELGRYEEKIETAQNLIKIGLANEKIAEVTGLELAVVEALYTART